MVELCPVRIERTQQPLYALLTISPHFPAISHKPKYPGQPNPVVLMAALIMFLCLPTILAGESKTGKEYIQIHAENQWEELDRSGLLQLLGDMLNAEDPPFAVRIANMLQDRGLPSSSVEKISMFLSDANGFESWMEKRIQFLTGSQKPRGEYPRERPVFQALRKAWVNHFYALLDNQETRVVNAFMREIFAEGVVQWQATSSNEPYFLQSFAYLEVPNGGEAMVVKHLVLANHRPGMQAKHVEDLSKRYPFLRTVPPLMRDIEPHRMSRLTSGYYFTTLQVP